MISTRFLPVVCGLVALTLLPTIIHSYSDSAVHDGRTTTSIPTSLAGYAGTSSGRNADWGKFRFDSDDWTQRIYRSGNDEVTLTVVRTYDAKAVYHHPELAVAYGPSYSRTEVTRFAQRPDVPVHVWYANPNTVSLYALHYDNTFVDDPIRFQLRMAGELLFSGRRAMTLFFLFDKQADTANGIESLPSLGLFFGAIDRFIASASAPR